LLRSRHECYYERIKAERGPEVTRVLAAHEIGHAYTVIAQGNHVEFVTLVPDDVSAGRCVRRGAKSRSLNFVDDRQASTEQPSDPLMTKDIVTACANIGAPEFGIPRIDDAEAFIRSQTNIVELVAGDVCMRVMYPDLSLHSTEHDWVQARALASVCCAAPEAFAFC